MLKNIRENKSAQFIAGLATIWFGWVLYRDGWLYAFSNPPEEGFGDAQWAALAATLIGTAVSFVQLIGILTLGVLSGLLPHVEEGARLLRRLLVKAREKAAQAVKDWRNKEKVEGEWNWKPLAAVVLAGVLWTGGQLGVIWDSIVDNIPNVIEVLPRGESNGRLVPDGRDGHIGDLDLTPKPKDRAKPDGQGDRKAVTPDDSGSSHGGDLGKRGSDPKPQPKEREKRGRLRLFKR